MPEHHRNGMQCRGGYQKAEAMRCLPGHNLPVDCDQSQISTGPDANDTWFLAWLGPACVWVWARWCFQSGGSGLEDGAKRWGIWRLLAGCCSLGFLVSCRVLGKHGRLASQFKLLVSLFSAGFCAKACSHFSNLAKLLLLTEDQNCNNLSIQRNSIGSCQGLQKTMNQQASIASLLHGQHLVVLPTNVADEMQLISVSSA